MSRQPKPPVFLHRSSYRQRRLRDAAKLVPFVGMLLWAIPLAWPTVSETDGSGIGSAAMLYIFGVWVVLIVLAAGLASRMRRIPTAADDQAAK